MLLREHPLTFARLSLETARNADALKVSDE